MYYHVCELYVLSIDVAVSLHMIDTVVSYMLKKIQSVKIRIQKIENKAEIKTHSEHKVAIHNTTQCIQC